MMKMGLLHLVLKTFEGLLGVMKCTQHYIALGEGLHLMEFLHVLDHGDCGCLLFIVRHFLPRFLGNSCDFGSFESFTILYIYQIYKSKNILKMRERNHNLR